MDHLFDNLKESDVLIKLGLNANNHWILHDESPINFLQYLAANFDDDNILTTEEFELYEELVKTGQYLEGDDLDKAIKELESKSPDILSYTQESVQEMRAELELLEARNLETEDRIGRMSKSIERQTLEEEVTNIKALEQEAHEKNLIKECLEKSIELTEIQKANYEAEIKLNQLYNSSQETSFWMCHMPLDQFFHKSTQLLSEVDSSVRRNFNVTTFVNDQENNQINSKISEVQNKIFEATKKKFEFDMTIASHENVIKNIGNNSDCDEFDSEELFNAVNDMNVKIDSLDLQLKISEKEAQSLVRKSTEYDLMEFFIKYYDENQKRNAQRLQTLNTIEDVVECVTLLYDFLWLTLKLDLDRIKNRVNSSSSLLKEVQEQNKRISQMKILSAQDPITPIKNFILSKLQHIINENMIVEPKKLSTIDGCLELMEEQENFDEEIRKSLLSNDVYNQFKDNFALIESQIASLREFVYKGPTNRPVLNDVKYYQKIYNCEESNQKAAKMFETLRRSYENNFLKPFNTDRFFKMEYNLWIYFLTSPAKVKKCIQEVQRKAANYQQRNAVVGK
ncbi:CLUMA_CG017636, isoform A [Clunio marinus]|uniref:CLUMA_CG017636, isoform A n=1 Tax=Clunio marinus TaxID=568069 RepID=A0A1J1IZH3_9DIPT|nr:CLUMA_CG017636, isoform A [Clunio marinus]